MKDMDESKFSMMEIGEESAVMDGIKMMSRSYVASWALNSTMDVQRLILAQERVPLFCDNIRCQGTELYLKKCPSDPWKKNHSSETTDAGVICSKFTAPYVWRSIRKPMLSRQVFILVYDATFDRI